MTNDHVNHSQHEVLSCINPLSPAYHTKYPALFIPLLPGRLVYVLDSGSEVNSELWLSAQAFLAQLLSGEGKRLPKIAHREEEGEEEDRQGVIIACLDSGKSNGKM